MAFELDPDDEGNKVFLHLVQFLTFSVALIMLATVLYLPIDIGDSNVEKSKFEMKAEVEQSFALPKTLQAETQMMPMAGAMVPMYPVYGRDMTDRRVWCATFIDRDEATAWIQASKVFGRAVKGAVIANQEKTDGETVEENATGSAAGGDTAGKAN